VPHPIAPSLRPLDDAALVATSYVSVRDRAGAGLLEAPAEAPVAVVPDPIADLARLWPLHVLEPHFRALLERKGADRGGNYLAVHVRNRSVAGMTAGEIAASLAGLARAVELTPILLAVGDAHQDGALARAISKELTAPHILLDDPASLKEVAAAAAFSRFYVGASLHAYVAAAAYGVPGVLVARPAYGKFSGFLEHTGRSGDLVRNWGEALAKALARKGEDRGEQIPASVHAALDEHWRSVAEAIRSPGRHARERQRFLSAYVAHGLSARGPAWAMDPVMHRAPRFVRAVA
jgi:polysaccharide pyruvyl transferase WcaK-like protein